MGSSAYIGEIADGTQPDGRQLDGKQRAQRGYLKKQNHWFFFLHESKKALIFWFNFVIFFRHCEKLIEFDKDIKSDF